MLYIQMIKKWDILVYILISIGSKYDEFLSEIKKIEAEKNLYIFTLGDYIDTNTLKEIKNYNVEPIPYKIVELFKKIVKISKED